jgi:hypothetical protein
MRTLRRVLRPGKEAVIFRSCSAVSGRLGYQSATWAVGKSSFAIYADIGRLREGSIALADALGISSDARHGGQSDKVMYLFPGSGNLKPRTIDEIQSEGEQLLSHWEQTRELSSCAEPDNPLAGSRQF